ncbi:MAG: Ig-like domain-containing protein, partial [bacterium]|nr:Ig-like domain-containing protein [bacterium]
MRHQKSSLLSLLFMCLAALVLAAGCGDSGSGGTYYNPGGGGSSSGGTSKFAEVIFSFPDFAATEAKMLKSVPDGTRYISFYGSNSQGDAIYGPVEYKAANKVNLPDVPVTTNIFFLQFRDSKHEIINLYATDKFVLKSGETTVVTVDDFEDKKHAPKSMAVTAESESLAAGYATQCAAKITYGNGAAEVATELVDWKSSAASAATVNNSDSKGLVKAIAPGSANITAEIADLKGTVAITVTDAVLESLEITTPDPFILMLATYQFKAQATFSDGSAKDVTNEVTWSSDNTEIAEIDENGLALAVKNGQANITATSANGQADTTTLSISDIADVREISIKRIDNDSKSTPLGFTASYQAIAKVSSEMRDYDVTDQVTWNTENADTGAFSDATPGLYETMGCATGDTVISCVLEENEVESKNTLDLAVTDAKITGLTVLGSLEDGDVENPYILSNRENIQFAVKADLSDGTTMMIEPSADLAWTVEPADAVADENGLVTPAEAGAQFKPEQYYSVKATYNYTYEPTGETETLEAETTLNVADALQVNEVTVEAVEPAGAAEVPVGHTVKYKATAKISTMDLTFDVTDQVTWSDVSAVGTMDAGLFTAETTGGPVDVIATLTLADIGGTEHEVASEAAQITVTDAILESIAIDQNAPQIINNNNDFAFTATATYSDGSTVTLDPASLPAGATMTWASADTSIAEIDETGAVTPKADTFGQTEITVTYTEGEVTADASTMLSAYDSMAVTEVTIDTVPAGVTECANGYTVQFQAAAKIGTKDMEIDVTRQVEWNNDEIAAIGS